MRTVRVGVVGCGIFGRRHALTIQGLAETELVGLVETNAARREEIVAEFPDVPMFADVDAAIANANAEAWVVATTTRAHVTVARTLLEAGHTVLLEKPISADLEEARSLAPWVRTESRNLLLGHSQLYNSEFRRLLEEKKRRGPIYFIDCVKHRPAAFTELFPDESPYHLLMVHDLYLVLALLDGREPVSFSAQVHRTPKGQHDVSLAQLIWEDGTVVSLTASLITPPGMPADGFDRTEVFGEGWSSRIVTNPRPLELWDDRARWPLELEIIDSPGCPTGMLAEEHRLFAALTRGEAEVPLGARYEDGLRVLSWLDTLVRCAEERTTG